MDDDSLAIFLSPSFRVSSLEIAAVFAPPLNIDVDPPTVQSIDFHRDGRLLVAVDSGGSIIQVDVVSGKVVKRFRCTKHPFAICRYTHHDQAVLLSSPASPSSLSSSSAGTAGSTNNSNLSHDLHYLSLYDNSYLRHFKGHSAAVTSLAMSPCSDDFASGSADRSVLLWNLKVPGAVARLPLPPAPQHAPPGAPNSQSVHVAYDPTGKVLAACYCFESADMATAAATVDSVSTGSKGPEPVVWKGCNVVKLFDAKNYATGPFATFTFDQATVAAFLVFQHEEKEKEAAAANLRAAAAPAALALGTAAGGADAPPASEVSDGTGAGVGSAGWAESLARSEWRGLRFSPGDGDFLLVPTASGTLLLIDAFDGHLVRAYAPPPPPPDTPQTPPSAVPADDDFFSGEAATFTPDGRQVLAGTAHGEVVVWAVPEPPKDDDDDDEEEGGSEGGDSGTSSEAATSAKSKEATPDADAGAVSASTTPAAATVVKRLGGHTSRVGAVACSPVFECVASGCSVLALWTSPADSSSSSSSSMTSSSPPTAFAAEGSAGDAPATTAVAAAVGGGCASSIEGSSLDADTDTTSSAVGASVSMADDE